MMLAEKHIILAEDDEDDSAFFEEALMTIPEAPSFLRARDGAELTSMLEKLSTPPLSDIHGSQHAPKEWYSMHPGDQKQSGYERFTDHRTFYLIKGRDRQ